jgi:SAM-dependent methyltransferase
MLARELLIRGDGATARDFAQRALHLAGSDPEILRLASEICSFGVHGWHFDIVRDRARNAAYEGALKRAIRPGMRVLDIGTGTGLLSMMAARAGAAEVICCEMNPVVAETAKAIIAKNGYADRIRVIAKHSSQIDVGKDMGGPADLLVSELFTNGMLEEAVLPVHEHAVARLLKPGAQTIPAAGIVRIALAEDVKRTKMTEAEGFDLSPFNRLVPHRYAITPGDERLVLKSEPADIMSFDFRSGGPFPPARAETTVRATASGANGVAQWIALIMDGEGRYENMPAPGAAFCWAANYFPAPEDFSASSGETIRVSCAHDRQALRIWAGK